MGIPLLTKSDQHLKISSASGHTTSNKSTQLSYRFLPIQDRFFNPGERTRDNGDLGDKTLTIEITFEHQSEHPLP